MKINTVILTWDEWNDIENEDITLRSRYEHLWIDLHKHHSMHHQLKVYGWNLFDFFLLKKQCAPNKQ